MGDFRDAILSFGATPWRKFIGMFESAAKRIKSAGRPLSSVRSSSSCKPPPTILAHSEQLFSAFMDNLPGFAWMKDIEGHYLYVNKRLEQLTPYQNGWLGKTDADLWSNETAAAIFRGTDQKVIATCKTLETVESYMVDREHRYAWVSKFPIFDSAGAVVGVGGSSADIPERKRAEEALQESEERFRQLFEAAFEAIILHDQGTILEVNQSFCRMYGYERAEVIGKSVLDMALPEFRELFLQKLRSGDTDPYESPVLRKDGTVFSAEVAGKPINYQGRVVRVGAVRDITEQKRNERRQAAQHAVTRVLAESATVAEATPQLLRVICESLRWKMGEFWDVSDRTNLLRCVETWHVPGLDATAFMEASRQAEFAPGVGLPGRVWQSGQPAWISDLMTDPHCARAAIAAKVGLRGAVALPILMGDQTLGVMVFFSRRTPEVDEDLLKMMSAIGSQIGQFTERKRAEEALLASERKYRDIFTFAPVGIYQSLRDGTLITANHTLAEMLGYASVDELLRVKLGSGVYFAEHEREKLIREYEGLGYAVDLDMQWKRKDSSPIWIQLSAHAIKGLNGETEYFEGFVRDISERKQAEGALREAERKSRDIFENAGEGIFQSTPDGRYIAANSALARMHGFASPEELIHSRQDISRQIYVDPTRREEFKRQLEEQGAVRGFEHQLFRKDGSKIWISVNARAVRDAQGAIQYYEGTAQDITERKRAETRSEAFANLAQNLSGAMTPLEAGQIIARTAQDLFGWDSCTLDLYDAEHDVIHPMLNVDTMGGKQVNVAPFISGRKPTPRGRGVIDHGPELILRKEPFVFDKDAVPFGDVSRPSVAIMTAPIRHASRVIGILSIQSYSPLVYDDVSMGDLQALADHCGEALNRIQAEEQLRESEERYRDLVENSRELICTHDLDGLILSANRAATEVLGHDREDYFGKKNLREILTPGALEGFEDYLARICNDGVASGIMRVQTSSGEHRIWEYYNTLRTEGVASPIVRGMARDITDRKRAEEALRESEERYRELFENAKDATFVHDLWGRYTSVNRAAERLLGYARAEILGKEVIHFFPPEQMEHIRECARKLVDEGETAYESEVVTKEGRRVAVDIESHLVFENGVPIGVQGTARDITERKAAEEKLKANSEQLRALSARLQSVREEEATRIAREIHDELGSALTRLKWDLELLSKERIKTQERVDRENSGQRIDEMIQLVDATVDTVRRISSELRPSILDDLGLAAALRWHTEQFQHRTGIVTACDCFVENLGLNQAQSTAVFRIFEEALTNVMRHAGAMKVDVRLEKDKGDLVLTIRDNGRGITEAEQLDPSSLGLLGMRERVSLIGGEISIAGIAGEGTLVTVRLPISRKH